MIVTSVQIKTAKTQKHLYCPVFTSKLLITLIGSLHLQGLVQNQIQHIKKNLILRLYSVMNKKSQAEYATITYGLTIERI